MVHSVNKKIGNMEFSFETGRMAKQANGAVYGSYEGTAVLATVCSSKDYNENISFFPLTVDYREKFYAAGKIPGGFFKRETRPSTKEILTSRLIDRPLRPMFADGFRNEIQVIVNVIAADRLNTPDVIAINSASCALALSDIPFDGPIGAVRMAYIDDEFIVNPTNAQIEVAELDMIVAGTEDAILMVEGASQELHSDFILNGIEKAHVYIKELIDLQKELVAKCGKEKKEVTLYTIPEGLEDEVKSIVFDDLSEVLKIASKQERYEKTDELYASLIEKYNDKIEDEPLYKSYLTDVFLKFEKEIVRDRIVNDGIRIDGRKTDDVRNIDIEINMLPSTHGSALFTRGETQSLGVVTLGDVKDEQFQDEIEAEGSESFLFHYNFPPFSVGEVKRVGPTSRREIGHGHLAERSLRPVLPEKTDFPYTIRIVSEILESNGSSSMASVCSGSLSLMATGVPIKNAVAGIAMGLIKTEDDFVVLTDILGQEDHLGDMDFKLAGTKAGITAFQMDIKIKGITKDIMAEAIKKANIGREHILDKMNEVISESKDKLPEAVPKFITLPIKDDKIGKLIGPGGKVIKKIQEDTKTSISIMEEEKCVKIFGADSQGLELAEQIVKDIITDVEPDQVYDGVVKRISNFGAFVEIKNGVTGLLHISKITDGYVKNVEDHLKIGQELKVKVESVDSVNNKISLTAVF